MLKIRKNPFNYFEDLDLLFDNLLIDSSNLLENKKYHYKENEKEIIIEMAIPGVNKNDIKLVFSEGNLKIKYDSKNGNTKWTNSFNETIEIISDVDENKIHAKFESGVIHINIPKKNKVINEKIIDIK
ncbi:MAG: hypothetical protein CMP68_04885 [Flavobacteriales bacterium]|nr:hypothetical protein [Flavobacteriales bacterium]|tara:strand:+ start:9335 stop:9718 length:384 start_codon:yes stop_codon:yes gene_type:complete